MAGKGYGGAGGGGGACGDRWCQTRGACYMGREWELSFRLGILPWIAVTYPAPVATATAVFLIYPISQEIKNDTLD
ncbi:hypothetical protein GOBAR_DD18301 [Gossypium barbadense]|nr:hypothetical protein GOBAR_DD18301 [Gossypium barbadense]